MRGVTSSDSQFLALQTEYKRRTARPALYHGATPLARSGCAHVLFVRAGFYCVALAGLEFAIQTKLAWNSEKGLDYQLKTNASSPSFLPVF